MKYKMITPMKKHLCFLLLIAVFASCIPQKDLAYLQGETRTGTNVQKLNDAPYKLQMGDILIIDIKTTSVENDKLVAMFKKSNTSLGNSDINSGVGQGFVNGNNYISGFTVNKKGFIRLPYIGEMNVLGLSTKEVRIEIEKEILKTFNSLKDIYVTVKLNGIKFTVTGEIGSPGTKVISQNNVNIIEAISSSGDILITGDKKNVVVWRKTITGKKKYIIDLTKASAFNSEAYNILPNDIIVVQPLKQKSWGVGTSGLQSLSTVISVLSLITSSVLLARNL